MRYLIAYGTMDDMTTRIAERFAQIARSHGHSADVVDTAALPPDFDPIGYEAWLLGGSMYAHRYQRSMGRFLDAHLGALVSKPSAFFSVGLAAVSKDPEEREAARRIAEEYPREHRWRPGAVGVFGGAFLLSPFEFWRRRFWRTITGRKNGDEGGRDWVAIDDFMKAFVQRTAAVPHPALGPSLAPVPVGAS